MAKALLDFVPLKTRGKGAHGIRTDPVSVMTMSASDVVSIAFAKTGPVLLFTIRFEMLPPASNDLVEMCKDDLAYFASQARRTFLFELQPCT